MSLSTLESAAIEFVRYDLAASRLKMQRQNSTHKCAAVSDGEPPCWDAEKHGEIGMEDVCPQCQVSTSRHAQRIHTVKFRRRALNKLRKLVSQL